MRFCPQRFCDEFKLYVEEAYQKFILNGQIWSAH
jgi:hypothetical protein